MKIKTFVELPIEVEVDYSPGRPAPAVQCHDDPGYSDSGDDETVEITDMVFDTGEIKTGVPGSLVEFIKNKIIDHVTDQCRDKFQQDPGDYYDEKEP